MFCTEISQNAPLSVLCRLRSKHTAEVLDVEVGHLNARAVVLHVDSERSCSRLGPAIGQPSPPGSWATLEILIGRTRIESLVTIRAHEGKKARLKCL